MAVREWRAGRVPGCVQSSAWGVPHAELFRGTTVKEVQWMDQVAWIYRARVNVPAPAVDETVQLCFAGLDFRYRIYLDGALCREGAGLFTPVAVDLGGSAGREVCVEVLLLPPPRSAEASETTKSRFSHGSDFGPALRTIGLWDCATLEVRPRLRVTDAWIETRLHNRERALVTVHAELSETVAEGSATIELAGTVRHVPLFNATRLDAFLEVLSPALWWPNGLGQPVLHDLRITLTAAAGRPAAEAFVRRVGLREITRVPAQGQRAEDIPLQFVVNGVPVFLCGVNWVPPDACIGDIGPAHYQRFLPQFRDGNVNVIRVWGGGLCEKRPFYDLCDELGLMVLQEFPVFIPGRSQPYLRLLQQEAASVVRKLRPHACLMLFSGGNENYHYWDALDSDEPVLKEAADKIRRLDGGINREWLRGATLRYDEPAHLVMGGVVAELAPHCLYQNTSAMEGEGEVHGIWNWNPVLGDERYRGYRSFHEYWLAANQHLYSEASVSGIANLQTIRDVLGDPDANAIPAFDSEVWQLHHAFYNCWDKLRDLWLDLPSTEKIFGPLRTLAELVQANQFLQAEGARFMVEELRRKQPRCTGVIWWGVNEPWPGLAGNVLIDYYGRPKPGWHALAQAYRPTILTLAHTELQPRKLQGDLWLCHNSRLPFAGHYLAVVENGDGTLREEYAGRCAANPGESMPLRKLLPTVIPPGDFLRVTCRLFADGIAAPVHENRYQFGHLRAAVLGLP